MSKPAFVLKITSCNLLGILYGIYIFYLFIKENFKSKERKRKKKRKREEKTEEIGDKRIKEGRVGREIKGEDKTGKIVLIMVPENQNI